MQNEAILHVVDDDFAVREALRILMESEHIPAQTYSSAEEFLDKGGPLKWGCLLLDVRMPGMNGLELMKELKGRGVAIPVVFITGHGDVDMAVQAMKAGATDFIEKPFNNDYLLGVVKNCLSTCKDINRIHELREEMKARLERLTKREREVMELLVAGKQNKVIARDLGISPRTVELHRAKVMEKLSAHTLPDVVRTAMLASEND